MISAQAANPANVQMWKHDREMSLRSRFHGCLVGAVVGDCLGAPFEGQGVRGGPGSYQNMMEKIKKLEMEEGQMLYTDDTAMTRCLADSLIHTGGTLEPRDLARRFAEEFKRSPGRGYGSNVETVLEGLGEPGIDVFLLAKQQFDGSGSYGNGGAMRVAPAALCNKGIDKVIQCAKDSALLTHYNPLGYNGAILQALAVHQALYTPTGKIDAVEFVKTLLSHIQEKVEGRAKREKTGSDAPERPANMQECVYTEKLEEVLSLLGQQKKEDVSPQDVVKKLGNNISAHKSVTTAIYSFLRCLTPVDGLEITNPFERTVLYAISLCGDTDTIASMAAAIAGAYHGIEMVPEKWQDICEGSNRAKEQAEELYKFLGKTTDEDGKERQKDKK